jgi:hypothetical protein
MLHPFAAISGISPCHIEDMPHMRHAILIKELCDKKIKAFGFAAVLTLLGMLTIQEGMEALAAYLRT